MTTVALTLLAGLALFILKKVFDYQGKLRAIRHHPGSRNLISSFGLLGVLFPKGIPGRIMAGGLRAFYAGHDDFKQYGMDIITEASVFPTPAAAFLVADAAAIKDIASSRARFPKPIEMYQSLSIFGPNIVASEGELWRRFRKVSAPAFSERNNRLEWDETVEIMQDLFENVWGEQRQIAVDEIADLAIPIALFVISAAGFGRRISWKDDQTVPAGHRMTFKDAITIVSVNVIYKLATPAWFVKYLGTSHMKKVSVAFEELEQHMREMISTRRTAEKKEEHYDLFTNLLEANDDDSDGSTKMSEQELLSNIFMFLLAGHETTAHTLCFAFALLALHQDKQEKLYQQIKGILPDGRAPTYEEMSLFTETLAVLYETLRLFPAASGVPKYAGEDTTLTTQDMNGNKVVVPIPQGATTVLHVSGLHHNPRYWENPYEFKPERFHGDWPRDAFVPFSSGARACIGRRFFEIESVVIVTMLVSRYKITVKAEPQFAHETFEERKARILQAKGGITLTPIHMPLVFTRRDQH